MTHLPSSIYIQQISYFTTTHYSLPIIVIASKIWHYLELKHGFEGLATVARIWIWCGFGRDKGEYTCSAENGVGEQITKTVNLNINGKYLSSQMFWWHLTTLIISNYQKILDTQLIPMLPDNYQIYPTTLLPIYE